MLASFGDTQVLCTVNYEAGVPRFLRGSGKGWLTAEYGMLPGATHTRTDREAVRGRQSGRSLEIQRLIGRSLRAALDLERFGEHTFKIDCDVLQADGGTRTCAITGASVALFDAITKLAAEEVLPADCWQGLVAAVSVGMVDGTAMLDLDYREDVAAKVDMNVVMTESGAFIEVQGTAEIGDFSMDELNQMLTLAKDGIAGMIALQKSALNGDAGPLSC